MVMVTEDCSNLARWFHAGSWHIGARLAVLAIVVCSTVWGVEPAEPFLNGLHERGYYDMALAYLDRVGSGPQVPRDFAEAVAYYHGLTLLHMADSQSDVDVRAQHLEEAQQKLQQFLTDRAKHPLASSARQAMAELPTKRARILLLKAESQTGKERTSTLGQARQLFEEAYRQLHEEREALRDELAMRAGGSASPQREDQRARYVQIQMDMAKLQFEKATTVKENSTAYRRELKDAAQAFGEIADKYRRWAAGLQAQLFRGRCYQEMQAWQDALADYEHLLAHEPETEAVARLRAKALERAIECWCHDDLRRYDAAIERGEAWLLAAKEQKPGDEDALAIHWQLARAYQLKGEAAAAETERRAQHANARKHAQTVARFPGTSQHAAQSLLTQLGSMVDAVGSSEWDTFLDAYQAGKNALWQYDQVQQASKSKPPAPEASRDATGDPGDKRAKPDAAKQGLDQLAVARRALERALALSDEKTSINELNEVRFFLSYLSFRQQRYYDAAILGEFLARHYPQHAHSARAAMIALTAYLQLYAGAAESERDFGMQHALSIADRIAKTWPDSEHAQEALGTLIEFSIHQGDLDRVDTLLGQIPDSAPSKGVTEMKAGRAFWSQYLRAAPRSAAHGTTPTNDDQEASRQKLREHARQLLTAGLNRTPSPNVTETSLLATLALAQIHLDSDRPTDALQLLEDQSRGPYTLCLQGHAATQLPGFSAETYRTALRARILSLATSSTPDAELPTVIATMDALKKAIGDAPDAHQRLTSLYVGLARDLETPLVRATGRRQEALAHGMDLVLRHVSQHSNDVAILLWTANTWSTIADSFAKTPASPKDKVQGYRKQAALAYQRVLKLAGEEGSRVDPQVRSSVQIRLASLMRTQGEYEAALELLRKVLGENEKLFEAQLEAARTLSTWGQAGKLEAYAQAISGYGKAGDRREPLVWGWGKLGNVAAQQIQLGPAQRPRFAPIFHESRYNLALAQYEQARRQKGDQRTQGLRRAKSTIATTRTFLETADADWQSRYEALNRKIEQAVASSKG